MYVKLTCTQSSNSISKKGSLGYKWGTFWKVNNKENQAVAGCSYKCMHCIFLNDKMEWVTWKKSEGRRVLIVLIGQGSTNFLLPFFLSCFSSSVKVMQPTWPRWSSVSIHDPKRTTLGWSWEKAALASTHNLSFCARETTFAGLCLCSSLTHLLQTPSQSVPRASLNLTKIMTGICLLLLGFEVEFTNLNLFPRRIGNVDLGCTPLNL